MNLKGIYPRYAYLRRASPPGVAKPEAEVVAPTPSRGTGVQLILGGPSAVVSKFLAPPPPKKKKKYTYDHPCLTLQVQVVSPA